MYRIICFCLTSFLLFSCSSKMMVKKVDSDFNPKGYKRVFVQGLDYHFHGGGDHSGHDEEEQSFDSKLCSQAFKEFGLRGFNLSDSESGVDIVVYVYLGKRRESHPYVPGAYPGLKKNDLVVDVVLNASQALVWRGVKPVKDSEKDVYQSLRELLDAYYAMESF